METKLMTLDGNVEVTVLKGEDGKWVVEIDTSLDVADSVNGPPIRVYVNDGCVFDGDEV